MFYTQSVRGWGSTRGGEEDQQAGELRRVLTAQVCQAERHLTGSLTLALWAETEAEASKIKIFHICVCVCAEKKKKNKPENKRENKT